jgi:hypothetical protein
MNKRYNTVFGYHTPERSKVYADTINAAMPDLKLTDSSWHNDACDSVSNDEIKVFFPNVAEGEETGNDDFTKFAIYHESDEYHEHAIERKTIEEVIEVLEEIVSTKNFDITDYLAEEKEEQDRINKLSRPTEY